MRERLIQQQLYTRERGGIFLSKDGYDTIAISSNLEKNFVKKYLHPICVYNTPNELKTRGEKDENLYPPVYTLIQPETGELIVGQAVYVPADFTGQRSTFFMHNYVVPTTLKEEWIKNPSQVFQVTPFSTSYDIANGQELTEISSLAYSNEDFVQNRQDLFNALNIDGTLFKQLLFAFMSSVFSKKKVYISLDVSLTDNNEYALKLLELIYSYMPYAARRIFGAVTFSNGPESRKNINVMFVERGSLQVRDRSLDKQFVFDFPNQRVTGVDLEGQEHEYLDFAWNALSNGQRLDDFFTFAELALHGLDEQVRNNFSSYYQLCAIYQLQKGALSFYQKNKVGMLHGILQFLARNYQEKPDLFKLFMRLVHGEGQMVERDIAVDYVDKVITFSRILNVQSQVLAEFTVKTLQHFKGQSLFTKLWEVLERDKVFYNQILAYLSENDYSYSDLIPLYVTEKFEHQQNLRKVLKDISKLLSTAPILLKNKDFQAITLKQLMLIVEKDPSPYLPVLDLQAILQKVTVSEHKVQLSVYKDEVISRAMELLVSKIHLQKVTLADVQLFGQVFVTNKDVVNGLTQLVKDETYKIMYAVYHLFFDSLRTTESYRSLTSGSVEMMQKMIKKIFKEDMNSHPFEKLIIAFEDRYSDIKHNELISFIVTNGSNEHILSYIKWSFRLYGRDPRYVAALKKYLITHPHSIWKDKTIKKQLKQEKSEPFRRLIADVQNKTASPAVRFLKKHALILAAIFGLIGLTTFGTIYVVSMLSDKDEPVNVEPKPVEPNVTPENSDGVEGDKPGDNIDEVESGEVGTQDEGTADETDTNGEVDPTESTNTDTSETTTKHSTTDQDSTEKQNTPGN